MFWHFIESESRAITENYEEKNEEQDQDTT